MVQAFTYKWAKYKKTKHLAQCIDLLTIKTVHDIKKKPEGSKFSTYIYSLIFVSSINDEYTVYYITT